MRGHFLRLLLATRASHAPPCAERLPLSGARRVLPAGDAADGCGGDCSTCSCDAAAREEAVAAVGRRVWRMAGYQVHNGRAAGPAVRG